MKLFNTFNGVFVPSFEAILGAVLFLILPNLVGEVGVVNMLVIVVLAHTLTAASAFSIGDCTSNLTKVGPGGMYAVSKRSLGGAFGGSIGIQLFLAQASSIGFYAVGFAEPLQDLLIRIPAWASLVDTYGWTVLQQKQIFATVIATIAFISAIIGADFIVKLQMVIFVVLIISVGSIFFTPMLGLTKAGFPVYPGQINWFGAGKVFTFWAAFTTFFPAVTGIDAGVGMSGNLRDPRKSLTQGTFSAIGITFVVYMALVVVFGLVEPTILVFKGVSIPTAVSVFSDSPTVYLLLLLGILFATGSSALSYFMTAPRTAQALAQDGLLPRFLGFLKSDLVPGGSEPRFATILTYVIVLAIVWAGDVTFAARIVGIAFLVVYGWINLAAFFERVSGNPSFRPTTKNHPLISLYGFLMAMMVISLDNPLVGLVVILSQMLIFFLLLRYKSGNKLEGVWWGVLFSLVNWGLERLGHIVQGTKNWRPIVGLFTFADEAEASRKLMDVGSTISDFKGLTLVNVLKSAKGGETNFPLPEGAQVVSVVGDSYDQAVRTAVQASVPGGLQVNTVLLPLDRRLSLVALVEDLMAKGRNVLLYKPGTERHESDRIDVWWKGEENGNFMALLSYIMTASDRERGRVVRGIRLLRKLFPGEDKEKAYAEMEVLMEGARLTGTIEIIPEDDETIHETIKRVSGDADLILIGMPGQRAQGVARMFNLDQVFFSREIGKYDGYPPILFVKAARVHDLLE